MNKVTEMRFLVFITLIVLATQFPIFNSFAQDEENSSDKTEKFIENFKFGANENNWKNVSGDWVYTLDGLHGGNLNKSGALLNNVAISAVNETNNFNASTSFRVFDIFKDGETAHYGSIVYSYVDPNNYEHAGVNIYLDDIYVVVSKIINGTLYHAPTWLGIKTNYSYTPGTLFNLSINVKGYDREIILNGTHFNITSNDLAKSGKIGLNYGKVNNIDFYSFQSNSSNDLTKISNTQSNYNSELAGDSVFMMLSGKSLPEENYIQIYDSSPFQIDNATITFQGPCDMDSLADLQVLVGSENTFYPIDWKPAQTDDPTGICKLQATIGNPSSSPINSIYLTNTSDDDIDFPPSTSILVSTGQISNP